MARACAHRSSNRRLVAQQIASKGSGMLLRSVAEGHATPERHASTTLPTSVAHKTKGGGGGARAHKKGCAHMKYTKGGEGASAQHPWADVQSTRVCTRHLTCSPRATPSRCVWPIAEPRPRTSPHTSERETRAMALGDAPTTSDANARRADARACGEGKRGCAVEQAGTAAPC